MKTSGEWQVKEAVRITASLIYVSGAPDSIQGSFYVGKRCLQKESSGVTL